MIYRNFEITCGSQIQIFVHSCTHLPVKVSFTDQKSFKDSINIFSLSIDDLIHFLTQYIKITLHQLNLTCQINFE